ncbi:hypothetical protein BDQ12DRAFT_629521 [Crucibulum laeve]|uniref:Integral membrane protein n=1 Tax=Crucibulum laeve TaxID=68775 RepID=A0A5C3M2M4_9AGAR|nr:hypothetical protein BDQ12DRAFT_629521 [Crucibulum laeve]
MSAVTERGHTPSWPSLYNPGREILHIEHKPPTQPGGAYLYHASDVFRFTLYWTLIFYTPIFLFCGLYAFWNYTFPPKLRSSRPQDDENLLSTMPKSPPSLPTLRPVPSLRSTIPPKANERRSRLAFAILVLLTFLSLSVAGSVIGSAILGFSLFGLYKSANFNMSTWIPFLLAVIQVVVGLLSIWPSIIDII